jgi:lipid-binding SYLF domain-containing protein
MNLQKVTKGCSAVAATFCLLIAMGWAQDDRSNQTDIAKRLQAAAEVFQEIMQAPDKGIPDKVLGDAKCVIIIPSMVKFAVGFGGQHGKGVVTCKAQNGWSAPAPVTLTGGSWGLQFGGEAVDLVMLVMNQKGVDHLLSSKFKIGADASAAAGPVGRHADAGSDWKLKAELLTYSRARGVFAGIDLSGAAIKQDKDETILLYKQFVPFSDLLSGKVPPPKEAQPLLATLEKYAPPSTRRGTSEKRSRQCVGTRLLVYSDPPAISPQFECEDAFRNC